MSKNTPIKICNETIHPGEQLTLALPLPEIYSCAPLHMPIKIIHGKKEGPCLLITAGMHGNQLNGTEIINQLFKMKQLKKLSGSLILVPVLNVYGLINRTRYFHGEVDLNTTFPGSSDGSHAERLSHLFISEIFKFAQYAIDMQTGLADHSNFPQLYIHKNDPKAAQLAKAFGVSIISSLPEKEGMLSTYALKQSIPFLLYESGEARRFDTQSIKIGIKGILHVMQTLGMLPAKTSKVTEPLQCFNVRHNIWVHAPVSGISHSMLKLGQSIKKGDTLSTINDPFGASETTTVNSPAEGVIVGKNNIPLVHEGEALFQIAVFENTQDETSTLENWEEHHTLRGEVVSPEVGNG